MTHPNETEGTGSGFTPGQPVAPPPAAAGPAGAPAPEPSTSTYPAATAPYPASAAPYPASAAPYPASAAPYPLPPTAPGRPKLSAWVWVLAGLSAVLLVLAGLVGLVYAGARSANDDQIAERDAKIAELQEEIQRLQDRRQELEQERDDALGELLTTQDQVEQQQACPDALIAFNETPIGSAEEDAAFAALLIACNASL